MEGGHVSRDEFVNMLDWGIARLPAGASSPSLRYNAVGVGMTPPPAAASPRRAGSESTSDTTPHAQQQSMRVTRVGAAGAAAPEVLLTASDFVLRTAPAMSLSTPGASAAPTTPFQQQQQQQPTVFPLLSSFSSEVQPVSPLVASAVPRSQMHGSVPSPAGTSDMRASPSTPLFTSPLTVAQWSSSLKGGGRSLAPAPAPASSDVVAAALQFVAAEKRRGYGLISPHTSTSASASAWK